MLKVGAEIVLLSFLLFTASARRTGRDMDEEDGVDRGNRYIDQMIADFLNATLHDIEPYRIPDSVFNFSKSVMLVTLTGEAKLHNGYVTGLSSLHRPENCYLTKDAGRIYVRADLGAGILTGHYSGTVTFMSYGPTISVKTNVPYVEIIMEASVDAETGKGGVLHKFHIDEIKGMNFEITGLGPLNWVANYMMSMLTWTFKGFITNFFEKWVRSFIAERIGDFPFRPE